MVKWLNSFSKKPFKPFNHSNHLTIPLIRHFQIGGDDISTAAFNESLIVVRDCVVARNGGHGIRNSATDGNGLRVRGCTVVDNGGYGFTGFTQIDSIAGSILAGNREGDVIGVSQVTYSLLADGLMLGPGNLTGDPASSTPCRGTTRCASPPPPSTAATPRTAAWTSRAARAPSMVTSTGSAPTLQSPVSSAR